MLCGNTYSMVIFIESLAMKKKFYDSLRQPLLMAYSVGNSSCTCLGGGLYSH